MDYSRPANSEKSDSQMSVTKRGTPLFDDELFGRAPTSTRPTPCADPLLRSMQDVSNTFAAQVPDDILDLYDPEYQTWAMTESERLGDIFKVENDLVQDMKKIAIVFSAPNLHSFKWLFTHILICSCLCEGLCIQKECCL